MVRGRPSKSEIREKITALLYRLQFSYGYEIYKNYKQLFDNATSRVVYYHLRKGVENGEFVNVNVERVIGNYSWGDESERVYYAVGPFAKTKQEWLDKSLNINSEVKKLDYDWGSEIKNKVDSLKSSAKTNDKNEKKRIINKCDKLLSWAKDKVNNYPELENEVNSIKLFLK